MSTLSTWPVGESHDRPVKRALLRVTPELLLALLTLDGKTLVKFRGLPKSSHIEAVSQDPLNGHVLIRLSGPDLYETPEGCYLTELTDVDVQTINLRFQ